ncbi:MAG: hypothetical protein A3C55_00390 [Gammaproteobacteria bacterium RIFCSPHIGHO2_02_FULL_42_13]|nr:MAG: hypothetical protein A3C55_00390 [Gammaproteobacteria bacterium RIFCSPHIGHO2_02_FULL_42_13]OGT68201.1 MAG: hypothetical protein A3H43_04050 [Gammaproteobacteria bacterium RIFCSPLOWO2_02_FULL_42_9]
MKLHRIVLPAFMACLFSNVSFAVTYNQVLAKKHEPPTDTIAVQKPSKKKVTAPEKDVQSLTQLLEQFTQDRDDPTPNYYWFGNRIGFAGLMNVELQDKTKPSFMNPRSDKISVAQTKLNIAAKANDWVRGQIGLFYATRADYYYPVASTNTNIDMEEAYIDVSNLKQYPFYFRAGKQSIPFGKYYRYPIMRTLTQQLSETQAVAAQLGFVDDSGFYGALYIFNGVAKNTNRNADDLNNYGAAIGYENLHHALGVNVGAGYLNNMADVGAIRNNLSVRYYTWRVNGLSAHLDMLSGPFDFAVRYVTALRGFSPVDFQYQDSRGMHNAKPSATSVAAGYRFQSMGRDSKILVSYQWSRDAYNTNASVNALKLPETRVSAGYGVSILQNTILAFEYDRDHDYGSRNGGTDSYSNAATLRLTVLI